VTLPARISVITLGITDLERSVRFYEALGWRHSPSSVESEIYWFTTVDSVLGLWPHEKLGADANVPTGELPSQFRGMTLGINVESDEEVDAAMQDAIAAGATVLRAPEPTDYGGYRGYFADPDGHIWEIVRANFRVTPEGKLDLD
jgi:predicted lactoylglutathione lyase